MKYKLSNELKTILINNVIFYREQMGLSQYALAERIGITPSYLGKIEKGEKEMSICVFDKLSKAFGVSMNTLLSDNRNNASIDNIVALLRNKSPKDLEAIERMVKFYSKELERQ